MLPSGNRTSNFSVESSQAWIVVVMQDNDAASKMMDIDLALILILVDCNPSEEDFLWKCSEMTLLLMENDSTKNLTN